MPTYMVSHRNIMCRTDAGCLVVPACSDSTTTTSPLQPSWSFFWLVPENIQFNVSVRTFTVEASIHFPNRGLSASNRNKRRHVWTFRSRVACEIRVIILRVIYLPFLTNIFNACTFRSRGSTMKSSKCTDITSRSVNGWAKTSSSQGQSRMPHMH